MEARAASAAGESWFQWVVAHFTELMNELLYVKYNNTGLQALLKKLLPSTPLNQLKNRVLVIGSQSYRYLSKSWAVNAMWHDIGSWSRSLQNNVKS